MISLSTSPAEGRQPVRASLPPTIVVGAEPEKANDLALRWAAREAALRGADLTVVSAWAWQDAGPWTAGMDRLARAEIHRAAERSVKSGVSIVHAQTPDVLVDGLVEQGRAATVLARRSRDATMVVIGSDHLSLIGRAVLGSVGSALVRQAVCPVVVVRAPAAELDGRAQVVVGVDGSPGDESALAFAFDFASRHDHPLRAVFAWHPPFADAAAPPPERAKVLIGEALAGWQERYPDVEVHRAVVRGHPVDVLVGAAASQTLLVVGRSSRLSRMGGRVGSVTLGALHHATCPVAVVPARERQSS
jgi:nucleotide-binding universal stress UspA family protein